MVILAGEFLKEAKPFIEEGVHPRVGGGGGGGDWYAVARLCWKALVALHRDTLDRC